MSTTGTRRRSGPTRTAMLTASTAVAALVLAACGSTVAPETVALAGGGSGTAIGATGSGTGPTGVDGGGIATDGGGSTDTGSGSTDGTGSGSGDSGGGTGGTGGDGGGSAGPSGPRAPDPGGTDKGVDCSGLADDTGLDSDSITIGNATDISGPVPGLFEESQKATQAFVAYFNASGSTICGRKLELVTYDTRTDGSADQQAAARACDDVFAMVGSMSAFDSGGAATTEQCGLPDVRAITTTKQRTACTICYAAQPAGPEEFQNAVPDYIMRNHGGGQKAAMLYLEGGAATENGPAQVRHMEKRGMKFVYVQSVSTAEFNYAPYVQAMKERGVETVQFVGANPFFGRLAQAMAQQDFKPELYLLDPTAYSPNFTETGGDAVVGTVVFVNFLPFEEARSNAEMQLYLQWLERVSPGSDPGFFGLFAWSATRLFVQRAASLGGDLSRETLIEAMGSVDGWTSNGLHSPQKVSAKRIGDCWRFITWTGSTWKALEGSKYQCRGTTAG
ncbi:ABC transporter substrate-binding protein [Nocardioides marinus]|uniref:ABC-type branched-subunit amino acid transport system substrate-binding protein n=1 Tax=Nocardioides marinus TaxID=374514 RepID=A0A7Y9YEY5_9ACTN|nr:ABC transporter substrate-binding protein [Nocardioides marinus]NYI10948.1 ABC-type branched-subunit amino acid transport system substrate-binding protein [Nocardioides marinus]